MLDATFEEKLLICAELMKMPGWTKLDVPSRESTRVLGVDVGAEAEAGVGSLVVVDRKLTEDDDTVVIDVTTVVVVWIEEVSPC